MNFTRQITTIYAVFKVLLKKIFDYFGAFSPQMGNLTYKALDLRIYNVHQIGSVEVADTRVHKAYPYDLQGMMIGFDNHG